MSPSFGEKPSVPAELLKDVRRETRDVLSGLKRERIGTTRGEAREVSRFWNDNETKKKFDRRAKELQGKYGKEQKTAEDLEKAATKAGEKAEEMKVKLESMGRDPSAIVAKLEKEKEEKLRLAEKAREIAEKTKEKLDKKTEALAEYEETLKKTGEEIVGRIEEKTNANNESLGKLTELDGKIIEAVKTINNTIQALTEQRRELKDELGNVSDVPAAKRELQKIILDVEREIEKARKIQEGLREQLNLAESRKKVYIEQNKKLSIEQKKIAKAAGLKIEEPEISEVTGEAAPEAPEAATASAAPEAAPTAAPVAPEASAGADDISERIAALEGEKARLEGMDLTPLAVETANLTKEQKKAAKKMMKTGKYEGMPTGTPDSEAAGAELNRIFQRLPQINRELADLRRQLHRAPAAERAVASEAPSASSAPVPESAPSAPEDNPSLSEAPPAAPEVAETKAAEKFEIDQEVNVKRSDGSIEAGWIVRKINKDGTVLIIKEERGPRDRVYNFSKRISMEELLEVNRPPASELSAPEAPEKQSEKVKNEIIEAIAPELSAEGIQEEVSYNSKAWYDDDFESKYIGGIKSQIEVMGDADDKELLRILNVKEGDAERLGKKEIVEIRAFIIAGLETKKLVAEKALKDNPNPRPEATVASEKPAMSEAVVPEVPAEKTVEEDVDLDALSALAEEVDAETAAQESGKKIKDAWEAWELVRQELSKSGGTMSKAERLEMNVKSSAAGKKYWEAKRDEAAEQGREDEVKEAEIQIASVERVLSDVQRQLDEEKKIS